MTPAGWITLGGVLVFAALAMIFTDLLKSILSVTIASVSLASYFYLLGAPYAAVFEAIVAAGLLTVLFLLMVSLTERGVAERVRRRKAVLVGGVGIIIFAIAAFLWSYVTSLPVETTPAFPDQFGEALWTGRSIDVLAVTIVLFIGVLGSMRLTTAQLESTPDGPDGDLEDSSDQSEVGVESGSTDEHFSGGNK